MLYFELNDGTALKYNVQENTLYTENDEPITIEFDSGFIKQNSLNVRIVLGKQCNFKCIYCMQDGQRESINPYPDMTVEELCAEIIRVKGNRGIGNITFWGGEPLVYFKEIKKFYEILRPYCLESQNGNFSFTTNGWLLKGEIFDWIIERIEDFGIALSYDGRGQFFRGIDVLNQKYDCGVCLSVLLKHYPEHMQFSIVLNKDNYNIKEDIFDVIAERVRFDCRHIQYDLNYMMLNNKESIDITIPKDKIVQSAINYYNNLVSGELNPYFGLIKRVDGFINSLGRTDYIKACHAVDQHILPLEMNGNIVICQNVNSWDTDSAGDSFRLANIKDIDVEGKLPEPKLTHMYNRYNTMCQNCCVKFICSGGCPILNHDLMEENCHYLIIKNLTIMLYAISVITQQKVKRVYYDTMSANRRFDYIL